MYAPFFNTHPYWQQWSLMALLSWALLALALPAAAMAEYPTFGIIASVTGETQLVIDIKSSPDAKPDRDQRVVNVAGVRSSGRDTNGVFQLERLVLGRDVELQNCSRRPLNPSQLFCDVIINLGRTTAPPVNLADMLKAWGLAQSGNEAAAPSTPAAKGDGLPSLKQLPTAMPPRGSRS
jgi:hypothetical protein